MHPLIGRVSKALADNTPMVNNGQSKTTPSNRRKGVHKNAILCEQNLLRQSM